MMHFAQRNLRQDITYWPPSAQNEYGHAGYGAPILLKGRWEGKVQQVRTPSGEEVTSTAQVFLDSDVAISGFLAPGDLTDQNTPPADVAYEIQNFMATPDLRNLGTERRAYL